MEYKEYKASEGKVLFNIDNFTYGNMMLCSVDTVLNLIEVNKEDAEEYQKTYYEELERLMRDPAVKKELEAMPKRAKIRAASNDINQLDDEMQERMALIDKRRTELLSELMTKGYNLNTAGTPESNIEEHIRGLLNE